ncbi:MAG TPA: polyketide synthase [bacterium]|nr:polyketide synthase [bacterium]
MTARQTSKVVFEPLSKEIGSLKIDDPANGNALSLEVVEDLTASLARIADDKDLKVLILQGSGEVFCSGADKEMLASIAAGKIAPADIRLSKLVLDLPIPVIAAMAGHAVGGGFALGLCADIAILSKTSRYGFTFMNMGFTPGMGSTRLIESVLLPALAHELLYTGQCKQGKEFIGKSGFNAIVETREVFPLALDLAHRIAEKHRESLVLLKRHLMSEKRKLVEEALQEEAGMHEVCFARADIARRIEDGYAG